MPICINIFFTNNDCDDLFRPGGKLIILNGKEDDYDQQDRNTCSCSDDQRWYTSAIEHLETLIEIMVIFFSIGNT